MGTLPLFRTAIDNLTPNQEELYTRLWRAWGTDTLARATWRKQFRAFGSKEPESDMDALLAVGLMETTDGGLRLREDD